MTPSDDLFQLIQSLTRSEKGYFKKYSARHVKNGQNTYIALFDAIAEQDVYDEAKLREKFRGKQFLKRLPAFKNYLYTLVLRSLRSYYADASASRRLRGLMDDYATLRVKNLYDQAVKVLSRARALAEKHNLDYYKPLIEGHERTIRSERFMAGVTAHSIEKSLANERKVLEELLRLNSLETMNKQLFKHISEQGSRGPDPAQLRDFINNPLLSDPAALTSMSAKFVFYQLKSTCYFHTGNYEASRAHILEALRLIDEQASHPESFPFVASSLLHNLVQLCILLNRVDEAQTYVERLKALPASAFTSPTDQLTSVRGSELTVSLKAGNFDALRRLRPALQHDIATFGDALHRYYQRYFAYHLGWICIALGEPAKALEHINVVLNDRLADVREDLYCFARILNLLVHYELGNTELLRSELRSTWRYLVQKQRTYRFETLLIQFMKKTISATSERALRREFTAFREELTALQGDPFEGIAFTYFYFIPWLDSKIEGIALEEAVRRYVQAANELAPKAG